MISFDIITEISNYWNVVLVDSTESNGTWNYTFSAPSYAQVIPADTSFNFGFNASPGNPTVTISNVSINSCPPAEQPIPKNYSISYCVTSEWTGGMNVDITLTNHENFTISDWVIGFDIDRMVSSFWKADQISGDFDTQYAFAAPNWQSELASGESFTFGIQFAEGTELPQNLCLISPSAHQIPEPRTYSLLMGLIVLVKLPTSKAKYRRLAKRVHQHAQPKAEYSNYAQYW